MRLCERSPGVSAPTGGRGFSEKAVPGGTPKACNVASFVPHADKQKSAPRPHGSHIFGSGVGPGSAPSGIETLGQFGNPWISAPRGLRQRLKSKQKVLQIAFVHLGTRHVTTFSRYFRVQEGLSRHGGRHGCPQRVDFGLNLAPSERVSGDPLSD